MLISRDAARLGFMCGCISVLAAGCGSGVPVPHYDPEAMAQAAMAEYDVNGDGKLDAAELDKCPALKEALPRIVKDKRPYLTQEDIAGRLRHFQASKIGLLGTRCRVIRNDAGVAGVTVTFIPEKFMGDAVRGGFGVSNAAGYVNIAREGEKIDGLSLGFYRVEVSKVDDSGKETIPAQFNVTSKLGMEVQNTQKSETLVIDVGP